MPNRIPIHRPARLKPLRKRDESARPNAHQRGYCDRAHKRWRAAVLNACNWQCVDCGRVDHGRAMHADHIVPIALGGARYDVANGAARCVSCHGRKTRHEQVPQNATPGGAV